MHNYKAKDIIVLVIAASIFVAALIFIFESSNPSKSTTSQATGSELISEPKFVSDYDKDTYTKLDKFVDYGVPDPQNLCKGDLFNIEAPLTPDQPCYALQQLGIIDNTQNTNSTNSNQNNISGDETSRNTQRRLIASTAKTAIESYYSKNKDYPSSPSDNQVATMLKSGGVLSSFVPSSGIYTDPSNENTRVCYSYNTKTTYWLYIVTEPTTAPDKCISGDPKDIQGVEDFSVR